ncbi:hypothetical protein SCALM49S_04318 [Streptomyces californicus]
MPVRLTAGSRWTVVSTLYAADSGVSVNRSRSMAASFRRNSSPLRWIVVLAPVYRANPECPAPSLIIGNAP